MVTIAHIVKKIIQSRPFLEEALGNKIVSYGNLAEELAPLIEEELGKKVKQAAVAMALRRYGDEIEKKNIAASKFPSHSELIMKTSLIDFTVRRTPSLLAKLKGIYNLVDFEKGDTLNVVIGNYEVSVIISERYREKLIDFLKGEKILNREEGLVAMTITFSKDFLHTPGVIFTVVKRLAWENINIYEIVSTLTELTLILQKKDSLRAYQSLQNLLAEKKG
ncbi:MAG TPA: hypothetical protein VJI46_01420 [Candidatus Nanoarchaeia archaeon]|nr:hypothetical protein [Candidatus Nanoarchaeia archaeon]